jgi:hypothetical protein
MKKVLSWLAGAAAAALCTTFAPVHAEANQAHRCDMTGTWIEAHENWLFSADYSLSDNGSDTFHGVFANPAAGATANITGAMLNGSWSIKFIYTDAGHPGWMRLLTGTGSFNRSSKNITVNGTEILKKSGVQTASGTFSMIGKCRGA